MLKNSLLAKLHFVQSTITETIEDEKRRDRKEGDAHVVVNARSKFAMFATQLNIYCVLPSDSSECKTIPLLRTH